MDWSSYPWARYEDSYDYLQQASFSLFDAEFYFPKMENGLYPRPFIVPFFYKLCGSDPEIIIPFQNIFFAGAGLFLVISLLSFLRSKVLQILFVIFAYFFMSWWNLQGWNMLVLSESITFSLFFSWLASFVQFIKQKNKVWFGVHAFFLILFALSRDYWPLLLIGFYVLHFGLLWLLKREINFKRPGVLLGIAVFAFIFQQQSAKVGDRHYLPVFNNVILRISQNSDHLNWFKAEGMPCVGVLQTKYANVQEEKEVFSAYHDQDLDPLKGWVKSDGKGVFMKFLVTHPARLLMFSGPKDDVKRVFGITPLYTGFITGFSPVSDSLFPLFHQDSFWIPLLLLFMLLFFYRKEKYLLVLSLSLFTYVYVLLCYNADAVEIERHLVFNRVLMDLLPIWSCFLLLDSDLVREKLLQFVSRDVE